MVASVLIAIVVLGEILEIFDDYFQNFNFSGSSEEVITKKEPFVLESRQSETANISGKIYLSLLPLEKAKRPSSIIEQIKKTIYSSLILKEIDIYAVDVSSMQIENFLVDVYGNRHLKFSADGGKAVFISDRANPNDNIRQVYTANADLSDIKQITFSDENAKKSSPAFSPDRKQIVFTVLGDDSGGNDKEAKFLPENSSIYMTDLNGNERFIVNGSNPMFSPDGKFLLALKSDGLYLVGLEFNDSKNVIPLPDNAKTKYSTIMKLSMSANGNTIAWTNALASQIYIIKISSWNPFVYNLEKTITDTHAFWPVFSPDGKYLAFQEVDDNNVNPRLAIIDLKNFNPIIKFNLGNYLPNAMWVTEWR